MLEIDEEKRSGSGRLFQMGGAENENVQLPIGAHKMALLEMFKRRACIYLIFCCETEGER